MTIRILWGYTLDWQVSECTNLYSGDDKHRLKPHKQTGKTTWLCTQVLGEVTEFILGGRFHLKCTHEVGCSFSHSAGFQLLSTQTHNENIDKYCTHWVSRPQTHLNSHRHICASTHLSQTVPYGLIRGQSIATCALKGPTDRLWHWQQTGAEQGIHTHRHTLTGAGYHAHVHLNTHKLVYTALRQIHTHSWRQTGTSCTSLGLRIESVSRLHTLAGLYIWIFMKTLLLVHLSSW